MICPPDRRRRVAATLLGITLLLTVAACGNGDDVEGRDSTRPSTSSSPSPTSSSPSPTSPSTSPPTAPSTTTAPEPAAPQGTPARIAIPAIGVDAAIVDLARNPDHTLDVPDFRDAGWWERGPEAGERGPAIIAGHVDSRDGPAVFYELRQLRPGDVIDIALDDGGTVSYRVDRTESFAKDAFPSLDVYGLTPGPELRLITCDGEFDTSTGHYVDNLVVFASIAT